MIKSAIVVTACHFARRDVLCNTTIARLEAALHWASYTRWPLPPIIVTGDVRYEPGSKTLGQLMRDYLIAKRFSGAVIMATGETGSFAEPRIVTRELKRQFPESQELLVISSNWQLWVGRPFWKRFARETGLGVKFISLPDTGGRRTRIIYAAYAAFVHTALAAGLWPWLEPFVYSRWYAKRQEGFRLNGCA